MHLNEIGAEQRLLLEVDLKPIQGSRFQPTGFADLGAAVYQHPDGRRRLLVESTQSMANRLEAVIVRQADVIPELKGMPYVRVQLKGACEAVTSSLVEPHRINSPFIIGNSNFDELFRQATGYRRSEILDWPKLARGVFRLDPNSLIHGVFMSNFEDGRIRFPRALSAFVEAEGVGEAASGGVKINPFDPTGTIRTPGVSKDVYGNVPYHRMEYTAARITAYFNIDLALWRGYELPAEAQEFLLLLSLFKIRRLLETGLRFRTACDLTPDSPLRSVRTDGIEIPEPAQLLEAVQASIKKCSAAGLFAEPPVTELETNTVKTSKGEAGSQEEPEPAGGE